MFFISTKAMDPWAFHLKLGYFRHENKADERKNIWHASAASELMITQGLKAVANLGRREIRITLPKNTRRSPWLG
jgi:hypothetical protein